MSLKPNPQLKSWWNRPLIGEVSLFDRFVCLLNPKYVPDLAVSLHNTEIEELEKIAPTIKMLDNENYHEKFLFYFRLKYKVEHSLDEYKDLHTFVEILDFAVHHIHHFRAINRVELDYQGKSQCELYNFVNQQLITNPDQILFNSLVETETEKTIALVNNESIKEAMSEYKKALLSISEKQIGVNLLSMFKKYQSNNYSLFDIVVRLLKQLKKEDLQDFDLLISLVETHFQELEKVGNFIGIPSQLNNPDTMAKILQYLALNHKYHSRNYRFGILIDNLQKWEKHYQTVLEVRNEYPRYHYKLPENFIQPIPAEEIYLKYQDCLLMVSNEYKI